MSEDTRGSILQRSILIQSPSEHTDTASPRSSLSQVYSNQHQHRLVRDFNWDAHHFGDALLEPVGVGGETGPGQVGGTVAASVLGLTVEQPRQFKPITLQITL